MKLVDKNGLKYFTFDKLSDVKHCFSTRVGGVSQGCYSSLNLAYREDKRENVIENYKRICAAVDVDINDIVWTRQVHTDNIRLVGKAERGQGLFYERPEEGYDALMTNEEGVALTGFSADCVLIYYYDRVNRAIAIAHSGWRGTVLEIGAKTVKAMENTFGTKADDLVCAIAPAIGSCCFQVDEPVVKEFRQKLPFSEEYISLDKENEGKFYIDLHKINELILINAGIPAHNIENSCFCTKCHPELFYSHRIMGNERGSLAGIISL